MTTWITQREAAKILGVGLSALPKMVLHGRLHPRERKRGRPTLDLAEVEAYRDQRSAVVRQLDERRAEAVSRSRTPPDDEYIWLSVPEVAALLGITRQAVNVRARKGQIPSTMKGDRRWIRRDQLEMVERAHAVARGEEPPRWTWSW